MTLIFHQKDTDIATIFKTSKTGFIQFAYSYLGNMEEAEDAVMDAFIQYWENKDKLDIQINNIKGYIFTILRNKCIDLLELRKYRLQKNEEMYRQMLGEIEINISSLRSCDPSELFSREINQIVNETIDTLPDRTREIFYKRYLEQKSYKSIAENFGISVKGVEFHISKCLNILRKKLKYYL